jgi:hypothetical protein
MHQQEADPPLQLMGDAEIPDDIIWYALFINNLRMDMNLPIAAIQRILTGINDYHLMHKWSPSHGYALPTNYKTISINHQVVKSCRYHFTFQYYQ